MQNYTLRLARPIFSHVKTLLSRVKSPCRALEGDLTKAPLWLFRMKIVYLQ